MRYLKSTHFFFCFHPRFDSGTWTIASAFVSLIIFTSLFVITIAYAVPTCACSTFYAHLTILPAVPKAVYAGVVLFFLLLSVSSILAIHGTFKARPRSLLLYILLLLLTEVAVFVGSIFIFILLSKFEQYLLFDNDTYVNMARLVMKEEIFAKLVDIFQNLSFILRQFLDMSLEEVLNVDKIMDAALKEEVIVVLGGIKQMMKVSVSILITGFNAFLITAIFTASSHYYRLKTRKVGHFSRTPDMDVHKVALSDSMKGTPSVTSSDISGIDTMPMSRFSRNRSPPRTRDSSARNSARIYSELSRNGSVKYEKGEVYTRSVPRDSRKLSYRANGSAPSKSQKRDLL